jgi:hypothetical protein
VYKEANGAVSMKRRSFLTSLALISAAGAALSQSANTNRAQTYLRPDGSLANW